MFRALSIVLIGRGVRRCVLRKNLAHMLLKGRGMCTPQQSDFSAGPPRVCQNLA
jgi:hypothetical protein